MISSLAGSERVRRLLRHRNRSASPCGVSCGPRAYWVRVPADSIYCPDSGSRCLSFRELNEFRSDLSVMLVQVLGDPRIAYHSGVGPHATGVKVEDYPYIMDVQPRKRELYEMATDTGERSSRSLESLNIRKAAGTAQSMEVLDIDQGYSIGGNASGGGAGGGGTFSQQGQWGTKRLSSGELSSIRTADEARERRETYSHSAQISQLYHLLDAYHVGTNRVVFFVQPRPHVVADPTIAADKPRPIEGIQEFFIVVNQPAGQGELCVDLRLDTGHITEGGPVADFDLDQVGITEVCEIEVARHE